jgi:hypothetical protein
MSEQFERENRYIVIKRSDLEKVPVSYRSSLVDPMFSLLSHLPRRKFLVIESDWPEYEQYWKRIELRVNDATGAQPEVVAVINEEGKIFKEKVVEYRPGIERLPVGTELVDIAHVIRLTAERDALQLRLNAADQRNDELGASLKDLISAVRSINRSPAYKVTVIGDDEPQYRQRKEWIDWVLELCDKASAGLEQPATAFGFPVVVDPALASNEMRLVQPAPHRPEDAPIQGMIAARGGEFAIMIDEANAHYGWTFKKHPDGMWVSGRKATDAEMQAARQYARATNQQ